MRFTLKDQADNPVVVNSDHVLYIAQAADPGSRAPLMGFSVVYFNLLVATQDALGRVTQTPLVILVKGSPEEIDAQMDSQASYGVVTVQ